MKYKPNDEQQRGNLLASTHFSYLESEEQIGAAWAMEQCLLGRRSAGAETACPLSSLSGPSHPRNRPHWLPPLRHKKRHPPVRRSVHSNRECSRQGPRCKNQYMPRVV